MKILFKISALILFGAFSMAAVNVDLAKGTPLSLQDDFIANATNQYLATVTKSPYFANTYSLLISGKKLYIPPIVSSPIYTSTAVDALLANGWGLGQLSERDMDLNAIEHFSINCSSKTMFVTSTNTWDADSCYFTLRTIYDFIFKQTFGTAPIQGLQ